MTPKQQYEARKAKRDKMRELDAEIARKEEQIDMLDTWDRMATALETLAITAEEILILSKAKP